MTPQNIIDEARFIINDNNVTIGYRQTDTELLTYVNDGIRECGMLNPGLFSTVTAYTCVTSKCEQALSFTTSLGLLEVLCIQNGAGLTLFDQDSMNQFNPGWRTDPVGPARQWSRFKNDPLHFFVYPAAPASSQILDVRHSRIPTAYAIGDTITDLPLSFQSALANYVVYRASSKDDENVVNQRAAQFYAAFTALLKG